MKDTFTPPAPLQTAVLFLVFNRPDTTAQVFEAIRKAKPPRLFVAADGPREGREGEAERVAKVREMATAVDWPCEVKTLFREDNLGCKYAVSGGITWFFEHEEQGIILEDDCLPSQSFFWFCEKYLEKFRNNKKIFSVNGSNYASYDCSEWHMQDIIYADVDVWGWATWRDRWSQYGHTLSDVRRGLLSVDFIKFAFTYFPIAQEIVINSIKSAYGIINTWDYPWTLSVLSVGGVAVTPRMNLIENIGFGPDATHTSTKPELRSVPIEEGCRLEVRLSPIELNKQYLKAIHKRSFLSIIRNNLKLIYFLSKIFIQNDR